MVIKRLDTYLDVYDKNNLITYIGNDIESNKNTLLKTLGL